MSYLSDIGTKTGAEFKAHRLRLEGIEGRELTNKVDAIVAPTVTDDTAAGYEVGSLWVDVTGDEAYTCVDATDGAAKWANTTLTAGALSISYDSNGSGLSSTTVKGAIDELDTDIETVEAEAAKNTAVNGTTTLVRYDRILGTKDITGMEYTGDQLDVVTYTGDNGTDMYYRDEMSYTDGDLVEVKHYHGTADITTASGTTTLNYTDGNLTTTSYVE